LSEGLYTQGTPSKLLTNMHLDPPPLDDEEEEEQTMYPSPLHVHHSTMEIEREKDKPDQWASPLAPSNMDESRGSTNESLFYFTAASALSTTTQESGWGLESFEEDTAKDFDYICDLETGDVAVICKE
jgi:hypothetical protein